MDDRDERAEAGSKVLVRAMHRRAWSAPEVARRTHGTISASSVLAYVNARTLPSPANALAIAQVLDAQSGEDLLRAWDFNDLADAYAEEATVAEGLCQEQSAPLPEHQVAVDDAAGVTGNRDGVVEHSLRYQGPPLTPDEETAVRNLLDLIRGRRIAG